MNKKFAFETGKLSIAFKLANGNGLGDCLIARKVFDALIELAPDCRIDILVEEEKHLIFAKAFYGDSKNLCLIFNHGESYEQLIENYDLALWVGGCHIVWLNRVNVPNVQAFAPKLFDSIIKIDSYNKQNVQDVGTWYVSVAFRNMMMARILHKNCFYFLSCGGALPIHDDKVNIPLLNEFKPAFENLRLDKYITIYTDINEKDRNNPNVKTWSVRYFTEYISLMKKRFPYIEIIQCGGHDVKIENADRHLLNIDLELTKYILANSLLHVGCEGGLVHLATALGTKCLVLFGSNGVDYSGYDRNINLASEVCQPCMYTLSDFKVCLRGAKEPPCMLSHTPKTVYEVTCTYLKNKV